MESKFQTSFIPKKSLEDGGVKIKSPISILFVSSVIVMLLTMGVSSGVFFYSKTLQSQIDSKKASLVSSEQSIDSSAIQNIVSVDSKLKIAENLLNNHTAVSNLFTLLQGSTLKNVQFTDFAFTYVSKDKVTISMKGQASSFEVVARQVEEFASSTLTKDSFKDPLFSDLALDDKGNVNFSFLTSLDSSVILYKNSLASTTPTIIPVVKATSASTSTASTSTLNIPKK